jgi:hypothetical protein
VTYDPPVYGKVTGNKRKGLEQVDVTVDEKESMESFIGFEESVAEGAKSIKYKFNVRVYSRIRVFQRRWGSNLSDSIVRHGNSVVRQFKGRVGSRVHGSRRVCITRGLRHRCSNVANFLGVSVELFSVLVCITTFAAFESHVGVVVIVILINVHGCHWSSFKFNVIANQR